MDGLLSICRYGDAIYCRLFLYASMVGALGLDFLFDFPHMGQPVMIVSLRSVEKIKEKSKQDKNTHSQS